MRARVDPGPELLALAAAQSGVLSAQQAESLGVGRHSRQRLLRSGQWQRLAGNVYCVQPFPVDWQGQAWAGVLLGGSASRLGGLSAAFLHGQVPEPPSAVQVLVPPTSRALDRPPWSFTRERPGFRDRRSPGEPPRLTLEDTVLDLCEGADAREVVHWVTQAVQTRRTSPVRLQRARDAPGRHGRRALLAELPGDDGQGADSPLELRYLRDVERPHGLPQPERQNRSRHRHRRDVVYLAYRLVVELDGRLGHEGVGRFRDMTRDNHATLDGEATLRYGFGDVAGSPCLVALQVAEVLLTRGWPGPFRRCPDCLF
ncbi:MAG: hypothetical protein ACJ72G_00365 [Friedmanniella sp.]